MIGTPVFWTCPGKAREGSAGGTEDEDVLQRDLAQARSAEDLNLAFNCCTIVVPRFVHLSHHPGVDGYTGTPEL